MALLLQGDGAGKDVEPARNHIIGSIVVLCDTERRDTLLVRSLIISARENG